MVINIVVTTLVYPHAIGPPFFAEAARDEARCVKLSLIIPHR